MTPVLDRLRSKAPPSKPLCTAIPKPFVPTGNVGVGGPYRIGPQPVKPNPPKLLNRRPGWIGGFFS